VMNAIRGDERQKSYNETSLESTVELCLFVEHYRSS
jgi:hypothetical protein